MKTVLMSQGERQRYSGLSRLRCLVVAALAVTSCSVEDDANTIVAGNAKNCASAQLLQQVVSIQGGRYRIGEDRFYAEERPVKEVELEPFEIDAAEVTNQQFREFVDTTGYVTRAERGLPEKAFEHIPAALRVPGSAVFTPLFKRENINPASWWNFVEGASWHAPEGPGSSILGREFHPVIHVAFEDAIAYAEWKGRRLPTEAEWEAAARGNQGANPYPWGTQSPNEHAEPPANTWQGVFPVVNQKNDGYEGTAPVGCYPPNSFGLFDMVGNVWEMTSDEFSKQRNGSASSIVQTTQAQELMSGVIKGGSYLCADNYCVRFRPAARQAQEWGLGASHIGFRTAKSIGNVKHD